MPAARLPAFFACDLRVGHITYGTAGRLRGALWQGRAIVNRE